MATKKCANGHMYDASIYGDQCPYCPKPDTTVTMPRTESTRRVETGTMPMGERTVVMAEQTMPMTEQTVPMTERTVVMTEMTVPMEEPKVAKQESQAVINDPQGRKMIGLLVSYDTNPSGDVYKVFEGRNELTIGGKKFSFFYIPQ